METPWTSWFSESEMSMNESCSFLHQWETATRNNQDMAPVLAPAAAGVGFSASLSSESHSHTSRSFHHQHHPMAPAGGAAQAACCVAESSKAQEIIMISWNLSSNGKADHPADGGSFSSPSAAPLTAVPTYGEGRAATKEKEETGASAPGAPLQKHETFVQRATLSPAQEHIMAERNRREKINQKFIALSAIIPGLKKADKASVLGDAVRYVKELEERVKALEDQNMSRTVESVILVNKSHISAGDGDCDGYCDGDGDGSSSSSDETSDHGQPSQKPFPEIEAKICGKTALFSIHCESRKGVVVKMLSEIENLNLSITSTNVMPFLGSSINITVTAQIEDEVPVTAADLVRKLKSVFN